MPGVRPRLYLSGVHAMRFVRKGWMRWEPRAKPIRVLVDDHGWLFGRGLGGWMRPPEHSIVKLLPGVHAFDHWRGEQWRNETWKCPEWAWIYGS